VAETHAAQPREPLQPTHKYRELLAAYFPPGHWTLTQPPITAENGQAMILLDTFRPREDGQVRVKKCAILFFPQGRERGEAPPRDAVVLEAPHGAQLQMDQGVQQGAGGFGRLESGKLLGEIVVRSDMRQPGPQDDLLLTTRDVDIQEGLIYTREKVDLQLGAHHGSGRQLEIRLISEERSRSTASGSAGPNLGKIDTLVVFQEVQAELAPGQLPRMSPTDGLATGAGAPPVQISCAGQFRFDFSKQVASFEKDVQLQQWHPDGKLDQMQCHDLSVYFAKNQPLASAPGATARTSPASPGKLQAATVEILGSANSPVIFESQSQQAHGRSERVLIETFAGRVTFDRGGAARQSDPTTTRPIQEVELFFAGHEIHAKQVQYTLPPKNSPARIGNFRASGSGWLRAITSKDPQDPPFEVRWTENMRLRRIDGKPVLSINGRPRLDMVGMGQLWADHLDLTLRERAVDGSEDDLLPSDIVPERLTASGQIAIDSAQLEGHVKELQVEFDYAPSSLVLPRPRADGKSASSRKFAARSGARAYNIRGDTLQMLVTVRQNEPEITSIDVHGQVVFRESSPRSTADQALQVVADHLRVQEADSPSARITLQGQPATITADGMLIRTENLQINRGSSRAWIKTPGEIELLLDRDLSGKQLATPQPMTVRWQQGMELDQDRITFSGDVRVQATEGTLDTQQMVVQLSAPVQFDGAASQRKTEIAQLQCAGGIRAVFSQHDALGLASVQTIKLEESFTANLQTGQLEGSGPGRLESVHLSGATNPLGPMANRQNQLASTQQGAQRLRFLGIEFVRGVEGNLHRRQIRVLGDVDAVYGPVDAWQQRLALTKRGLPGPDTLWISCQQLGVAESPLANRHSSQTNGLGPMELEAAGNVTIEGPEQDRGNFTARAQRAKYDQTKRSFMLEGTNQQPATITHQEFTGGPSSTTNALKIIYFQDNGDVKVNGLMPGQLRQFAPAATQFAPAATQFAPANP
jgi:lipopolysaccharide export system protein LptA